MIYISIMLMKDPDIFGLIEEIAEHYRNNISNRYTRRVLAGLQIDMNTWSLIEDMTEKIENYRFQGYHIDELYMQVLALSRFILQARKEIGSNTRLFLIGNEHPSDRVLATMAASNFNSNLKVLADKINLLYLKMVKIDKENCGNKAPIYTQIPELKEMGRMLVE